jgi:hypothetical protein
VFPKIKIKLKLKPWYPLYGLLLQWLERAGVKKESPKVTPCLCLVSTWDWKDDPKFTFRAAFHDSPNPIASDIFWVNFTKF